MKKILILIISIFSFQFSFSQKTNIIKSYSIGLKISGSLSNFTGVDTTYKNKLGFGVGVFADYPISKRLDLYSEITYNLKGSKEIMPIYLLDLGFTGINYPSSPLFETKIIKLNYLTLPILLKYKIHSPKGFGLLIGPEFNYLIQSKVIVNYNGSSRTVPVSYEYPNGPKKFDLGLDIGLQYHILKRIEIDLRNTYGLIPKIIDAYQATVHNQAWQLGVSYKL